MYLIRRCDDSLMRSIQSMKRVLNSMVADLIFLIDFHDAARSDDDQKQALATILEILEGAQGNRSVCMITLSDNVTYAANMHFPSDLESSRIYLSKYWNVLKLRRRFSKNESQ